MKKYFNNIRLFFRNIRLSFDRSFSSGQSKQLMWLVAFMALVYIALVALSHLTQLYTPTTDENRRWYDILFQLLDPGEGSESMTPAFAILVAMFGLVIFGGMLISVMSNVLERRVESYTNGATNYKISNHVVVIGFNLSVPSLLNKIHKEYSDSYILLMSEKESDTIRDLLHSYLDDETEKHVVVLRGVLTAEDDIERLSLNNNPWEVYVLGEEDDDCHDANNLKCVEIISEVVNDDNGRLRCYVQIDSDTTYSVLQHVDFGEKFMTKREDEKGKDKVAAVKLVFLPFNFNEIWAQKVIATVNDSKYQSLDSKVITYEPLDGGGITSDSKKHVHLIIAGTNEMATSIAVNAAHILHFPNFKDGNFSTCSHITFIDKDIHDFGTKFRLQYHNLFELSRWREVECKECNDSESYWNDAFASEDCKYKHLGDVNFMDIQWEFISGDIYDDDVQKYLINCTENDNEKTTIALCSEDSELNAALCMALPDKICGKAHQILVRQKESPTTIELISKLSKNNNNVKAFGMITECYSENLISDKYGKIINALYAQLYNNIKDFNNKNERETAWYDSTILEKWSSIYCANMLYVKLRSLGLKVVEELKEGIVLAKLKDEELNRMLQFVEHNRWNTEKLILGFAPLTKEEQDNNKDKAKETKEYKEKKKLGVCHINICSNKKLDEIRKEDRKPDEYLNSKLCNLHDLYRSKNT